MSKNPKNPTENDFKCKINYFSITERDKIPKENEVQQNNNSYLQNGENLSKNNSSIKTNIYQANNLTNINAKTPISGFDY